MSTTVYTFSGTGNSLAVARHLVERIGAELVPIPSLIDRQRVVVEADACGMVFPVYHKSIPLILKRFVEKLVIPNGAYTFAVCTYGDTPGLAIDHLRKLMRDQGNDLAAGFGVQMPYNYLTPSPVVRGFFRSFTLREVPTEKQEALLGDAPKEIERIADAVQARTSGRFLAKPDPITRLTDRLNLPEVLAKPVWLRIAGVTDPTDRPFIESRQVMDRAFWADEACNGCGVCSRICPVGNVAMVDDAARGHEIPTWQQRCEQCFACLQWCPQEAIQFGSGTGGRRRYHHPDVTVADMARCASRD